MAQNLVPIFPQNSATYIADWGNIQTQVDGAETVSRHLPSHGLATWPLNCFRHFFHFILPLSAPSTRVRWKVFSAPSTFTPVYIISYNYTFIHINININIKIYIDIIINIEIDIDIDINIDIYICNVFVQMVCQGGDHSKVIFTTVDIHGSLSNLSMNSCQLT